MMVEPNSATLGYVNETTMPAETDHSQISKLKRDEGGIYSKVKATIRKALVSTARIVASAETNQEMPKVSC